ncbi:FAD binding domain-containing protein [Phyllobacterium endophyticum]|uniref:FAD-binding molybdopterin dehydrogenase n=1 Tax=Phyllobacterium endophyticum TaxID=1149773 RepID=A0A2P7ASA8_9HYPH|nr:xanthine dehydrogenase family protein subunit M [Phyllobacterium endophyticum]MBB3236787.1 xanthine dehydrogenase YagS FAD-binding subunit [Phyllobacterium endophyticum]PSH57060.1 FAD-binding molybdopterin dehydrogenase [Phyllobacterium endophyticum]TYR40340.1 xanthine dehydrogenase family protein subunit M [Phyllobacterium endophyticum]
MQGLNYTFARSAEEAVAQFAGAGGSARYIAGGTNLYDLMKLGIERPAHLIDVSRIDGMDAIETDGEVLRFGGRALMADVAYAPVVRDEYPLLSQSLLKAASQQLRNMATVGGNLLQRTRCMYFRNGAGSSSMVGVYPCNKREPHSGCSAIGGVDRTQAVLGTSQACTAVAPGDWPVALMAMDATIETLGPQGARALPIAEFYRLPGDTPHSEFNLNPGELVTAITVRKTPAGRRSTYHKVRDRESYAFALASAAVAVEMEGATVRAARIALGGVATTPWRSSAAEAVVTGSTLTRELAIQAGRAAFADARSGKQNAFKIELGARVVADALIIAAERRA